MGLRNLIPFRRPSPIVGAPIETTGFAAVPSYEEHEPAADDLVLSPDEGDWPEKTYEELIEDAIQVFASAGCLAPAYEPEIAYWHPGVMVEQGAREEYSKISIAYATFPHSVAFAVSYCSPKDQFSRKAGRALAVSRLQAGEFAEIPTRGHLTNSQARSVIESLIDCGHLLALPNFPAEQQITVIG